VITTNATAATSTLVIPSFSVKNAGPYTCIVSNYSGIYKTATATLTAVQPVLVKKVAPGATAEVQLTKPAGTRSLVLKPIATGTKPFTYQWTKDGVTLDGQTASSLKLLNLTTDMSGEYKVTVDNGASSDEGTVTLTVQ